MDAVLDAAALTYVAAAVSTLLTLFYFLMRSGLLGRRCASCPARRCGLPLIPWRGALAFPECRFLDATPSA